MIHIIFKKFILLICNQVCRGRMAMMLLIKQEIITHVEDARKLDGIRSTI